MGQRGRPPGRTEEQSRMSGDALVSSGGNVRPWVTYSLLLICAFSLAYARTLEGDVRAASDVALDAAVEYLQAHPYLVPAAVLEERMGGAAIRSARELFERDRDRRGALPVLRGVKRRQQEQLDQLVDNGLAPLTELPKYRAGLQASERSPSSFLLHPFIHAGWLHLIGNGLCLLVLGFFVERAWGKGVFAMFLVLTVVASASAFIAGNPGLEDPFIGTSGVLAGVLAAFTVRFARAWRDPTTGLLILLTAAWLVGPVAYGVEWSVASELGNSSTGASYWAIGGGAAFGFLAAMLIVLGKIEETLVHPQQAAARTKRVAPELERALQEHASGRVEEAFQLLQAVLQKQPDDRNALLAMWDIATDLGRPEDATRALLQVIREEVRTGASVPAVGHWLDLSSRGLDAEAEPTLLIRMALLLRDADHPGAALDALKKALDAADGTDESVVAARVARASRDIDPEVAEDAAWRALGSMTLDIEERRSLEALLSQLDPKAGAAAERFERSGRPTGIRPAIPDPEATPEPRAEEPSHWEDPELRDEGEAREEPTAQPEPRLPSGYAPTRPVPIDLDVVSRTLQLVPAVPTELATEGLVIEAEGAGAKKRVPYDRVGAICVVAIEGISNRPVIVVDLVMNWKSARSSEPLKVIRLRADKFDPRRLIDQRGSPSPLDAMRLFIEQLLEKTDATPLPDLQAARGLPFASFSDLESYHRHVLSVETSPGAYEWSDE